MPGDAEVAGAVQSMHEQQSGWRAGDLLTFTLPAGGIIDPTTARVACVLPGGFLVVEIVRAGLMLSIDQSSIVDRFA